MHTYATYEESGCSVVVDDVLVFLLLQNRQRLQGQRCRWQCQSKWRVVCRRTFHWRLGRIWWRLWWRRRRRRLWWRRRWPPPPPPQPPPPPPPPQPPPDPAQAPVKSPPANHAPFGLALPSAALPL